jgi:hypothetical protein
MRCHAVLKGKVLRPLAEIIMSFALSPWSAIAIVYANNYSHIQSQLPGAPPSAGTRAKYNAWALYASCSRNALAIVRA